MTVQHFTAQSIINLSSSRYDFNNVKRGVKHQIIIVWIFMIITLHFWLSEQQKTMGALADLADWKIHISAWLGYIRWTWCEPTMIIIWNGICRWMVLKYMRLIVRNHTFWHVRPMKTQISLRIRAVWSESSLSAWRNLVSLAIRNALCEDSDQTARMRRLIWIFAGRSCPTVHFLMFRRILISCLRIL